MPDLFVIAGSNGSGKTTFAKRFLPEEARCTRFLNTDLIAGGLSPFEPTLTQIQAGRLMLQQLKEMAKKRESFCLETTLSGKTYLTLFRRMKKEGYAIHIVFLWLPDVKISIERVKERVSMGGHDIPRKDLRRRFKSGIYNLFNLYKSVVDDWVIYDNYGMTHQIVSEMKNKKIYIYDKEKFEKIKKMICKRSKYGQSKK